MRKVLTRIELLEQEKPGLEDQVCRWFAQGIAATKVAELLLEKYQVRIRPRTVGGYRAARWVPMCHRAQERKEAQLVDREIAREEEIRRSFSSTPLGGAQ